MASRILTRPAIRRGSIREFFAGDPYLKGCWSLDGHARDESGNGNHGTPANLVYVSGMIPGLSGRFNGTSSLIDVGTAIAQTGEFTAMAWFNPFTVAVGTGVIISNDKINANYQNYSIEVNRTAGKLTATWGGVARLLNTTPLRVNSLYFAVFVRSGSTGAWLARFNLNGKEDGSATTSANPNAGTSTSTSIGRYATYAGYYFSGLIDETAIFNRPLSPAEISQYYQWAISEPRKYWYYSPAILNQQQVLMGGGLSDGITLMGGY